MSTVTQMKCACDSCLCVVDIEAAVKKNDKYYCSDVCANGDPDGAGCCQAGCECHA